MRFAALTALAVLTATLFGVQPAAAETAAGDPICFQFTVDGRYVRVCIPTP